MTLAHLLPALWVCARNPPIGRVLKNLRDRGYRGQSPLSGGLGDTPQVQKTRPRAVLPRKDVRRGRGVEGLLQQPAGAGICPQEECRPVRRRRRGRIPLCRGLRRPARRRREPGSCCGEHADIAHRAQRPPTTSGNETRTAKHGIGRGRDARPTSRPTPPRRLPAALSIRKGVVSPIVPNEYIGLYSQRRVAYPLS